MAEITIYHNPRCGKSRQTLELLRSRGLDPRVVEYLKVPPDENTLRDLLVRLGMSPEELVRRKEPLYAELKLAGANGEALLAAMVTHPILIERPIVVRGRQARLGRPPEKVLEIL